MRRAAVVQYHTSTDSAEHNRSLIKDVLIELASCDPGGLDYQVFQVEGGVGFLHVAVLTAPPTRSRTAAPTGSFTGSFSSAWRRRRLSAARC